MEEQSTINKVEERLDRALARQDWIDVFPHHSLMNGVAGISARSPIIFFPFLKKKPIKKKKFSFWKQMVKGAGA